MGSNAWTLQNVAALSARRKKKMARDGYQYRGPESAAAAGPALRGADAGRG